MIALQQVQPFRRIPGPALGFVQSGAQSEGVGDGYVAGVWVQARPGLVPCASVVAGEGAVVGPGDWRVALEAGCWSLVKCTVHSERVTLPNAVLFGGMSYGRRKECRVRRAFAASDRARVIHKM